MKNSQILCRFAKKTVLSVALMVLASPFLPAADVDTLQVNPPLANKEYFDKGVNTGLALMRGVEFNNDEQFWNTWNYLYDGTGDHYTHFDQPQKGAFWKGVAIAVDSRFSSGWQGEVQRSRFTKITYTYHSDFRPSQSDTFWITRLLQTQFNQTKDLDEKSFPEYCSADCYDCFKLDETTQLPKRIMQCYYFWLKTLRENIYTAAAGFEKADLSDKARQAAILKDAGEAFKMALNDK